MRGMHACKINLYNHTYIAYVRAMHPTHIYRHTRNSMRDTYKRNSMRDKRHPHKPHESYIQSHVHRMCARHASDSYIQTHS